MLLFSAVPAILVLGVLMLLEIGLRLFGDPRPYRLASPYQYDGQEWLQVNRRYLEKYFPASSPLIPELKPTILHAVKRPGEIRILCLGGSSMFGTPYQSGASAPAILQKQLRHLFPDREITVINLGASAINTNVIADFLPQTMMLEPDAVLIYAGHNEFYGPDGVGASWMERAAPWLTEVKYRLRDLRIVGQIQRWLHAAWTRHSSKEAELNLMRQVSQGAHVPDGSAEEQRIVRMFHTNLLHIVKFYRERNLPVIVSDIASNLLFPPFASDSTAAPEFAPAVLHGKDTASILAALTDARRRDSTNAYLNYSLGAFLAERGDSASALPLLVLARDEDLLKFRAPSVMDTVIREVCRATATPLVSTVALFDTISPGRIPGPMLFWEHLHPRAIGYFHIADLFLHALLAQRVLPSADPDSIFAARLPFDVHRLSISWLDLALADLSVQALTGRWPFENFHVPTPTFDSADTALQHVALEVYANRVSWNEGNLRCAEWFARNGVFKDAGTSYEAILEEYPRAYVVRYLLANLLRDQGLLHDAEAQYRLVVATNPSYPYARVELGLLLINDGAFAEAEQQLSSALDLSVTPSAIPPSLKASAYYGLAAIRANQGKFDQALTLVDQSLHISPTYTAALQFRRRILQAMRH
jgi:tetratricopeptide (TPR) repeat protein